MSIARQIDLYIYTTKRKEDRGSPCLNPQVGWNLGMGIKKVMNSKNSIPLYQRPCSFHTIGPTQKYWKKRLFAYYGMFQKQL
jgi:hypothetical protein